MTSHNFKWLRFVRYILWGMVGLAVLLSGGAYIFQNGDRKEISSVKETGESAIHSDFSLIDHQGNRVSEASFPGRWQLVFFGFTHCPDVCPTTLAYMADTLDRMGREAERVAPIFITIDPARDTPDVMAEYVGAFHPTLIGLTGSEEEVAAAAEAFRVYYERLDQDTAPDGYLMAHSGHIYLMSPDGRYQTVFREGDQPAEGMAIRILAIMNGKAL
jgi:protein SCO1/2